MTPETMTKAEKTCLLYLEVCAVDFGGLVQGARLNKADHEACARFAEFGLAELYRVPAALVSMQGGFPQNHFVLLTDAGFALAHQLRRLRSDHMRKQGAPADVVSELIERGKLKVEVAA